MNRFLHIAVLLLAGMMAKAYDGGFVDANIAAGTDSVRADSLLPRPAVRKKNPLLRLLDKALEVDTNYIERNKFNVTLMTRSDWRFKQIRLSGTDDDGRTQSLYFRPHSQVTIGPYVGYSLLFLGWTVDLGSNLTTNNSNLYISLYAPMFGIDYYYENDIDGYKIQHIEGFDHEVVENSKHQPFPGFQQPGQDFPVALRSRACAQDQQQHHRRH